MPDTISVHSDFFTSQFDFKLHLTLAALQKICKDLEVIIQICQMHPGQHWEKCLNFDAPASNVYQTFSTEFGAKILHLHWASVDS